MKTFDLKKALAGSPVTLRDGRKAYILKKLDNPSKLTNALIGYYVDENEQQVASTWCLNGCYIDNEERMSDIIEMWYDKPAIKEILPKFRTVEYLGVNVIIPGSHEWLGVNKDGSLFSFDIKPNYHNTYWSNYSDYGTCERIGTVELNGNSWEHTLRHFPLDKKD